MWLHWDRLPALASACPAGGLPSQSSPSLIGRLTSGGRFRLGHAALTDADALEVAVSPAVEIPGALIGSSNQLLAAGAANLALGDAPALVDDGRFG